MPIPIVVAMVAVFFSSAMAAAWLVARRPGKSGWTDVTWSYAVGIGSILSVIFVKGSSLIERRVLAAILVGAWSFRLGTHILKRTLKGADDPRYAELRKQWGRDWPRRLFLFLQIQAAAGFCLVVAVTATALNSAPALAWSDWAGAAWLLVAIAGEAVADRQLRDFAANPANKGKVNDAGLWAWSRHPNYFFEWLSWWAYAIIAIGPSFRFGWTWAALIGPALMYWLLVHASGIPPTEAHMVRSRGEAFRAYQRRVNAFFPGPGKR